MERVDDDAELLAEILELFREQAGPLRGEIEAAFDRRDGPALERAAHSLKGASANISAEQVREAARTLEQTARDGDWAGAGTAWDELTRALPRLDAALRDFHQGNKAE